MPYFDMQAIVETENTAALAGSVDTGQSLSRPKTAQTALSILFAVDGLTFGTWAALIPFFQRKFDLSNGKLSWALFGMVLGAMISMSVTGQVIARWGSNRIAGPAAIGFAATLAALAVVPTYSVFIAVAVFFGLWKGALDVSVNAQAISVENARQAPIMSGFQGYWSAGGLCAATGLGVLMKEGLAAAELMTGMAVLLALLSICTLGRLLPDAADRATRISPAKSKKTTLLLALGGLAFLALFSEGAMFDWSAVYARTVGHLSVELAPFGFAAFALCMATGRFLGDILVARIGPSQTLRLSGFVLVLGIVAAVSIPQWQVILGGFGLVGFGTANIVPVLFGAAGRIEGHHAGSSLATVTTLGYLGFLSGPPLVGFVSAETSLPVALSLVILSGFVIATWGAAIVRKGPKDIGS
jgi:predicted MFS family arabinose efflux permease